MKLIPLIFFLSFILTGCSEHPLCEEKRSLTAKTAIGISNAFKEGGTLRDLNSGTNNLEKLIQVRQEIELRKISCKD